MRCARRAPAAFLAWGVESGALARVRGRNDICLPDGDRCLFPEVLGTVVERLKRAIHSCSSVILPARGVEVLLGVLDHHDRRVDRRADGNCAETHPLGTHSRRAHADECIEMRIGSIRMPTRALRTCNRNKTSGARLMLYAWLREARPSGVNSHQCALLAHRKRSSETCDDRPHR